MSREVKIGLFSVGVIISLYLGVNFVKSRSIFSREDKYYAVYNQADGIQVSSPVLIKGFRVGTVEKVTFDINTTNVIVEMSVKSDYPITLDSKAKIASTGLLGSKVMEIQLGNSKEFYHSGDTIQSSIDPSLLQIAGDEYEHLKVQASTMINQLSKALVSINEVLSQQNVENISSTLVNLEQMSGTINGLVETQTANLNATVDNIAELSGALRRSAPRIENTLERIEQASDSIPVLLAQATQAISTLNIVLDNLEKGEGTVGKLMTDEQLYNNLTSASRSLNLLLEDLKANPKKYVNITVFGKKSNNN